VGKILSRHEEEQKCPEFDVQDEERPDVKKRFSAIHLWVLSDLPPKRGRGLPHFRVGDRVQYQVGDRMTTGTIERIVTSEELTSGNRIIRASKEDPQFIIKNDHAGTTSHHLIGALERLSPEMESLPESVARQPGTADLKPGDKVQYKQGRDMQTGVILKKLTETTDFGGHLIHATEHDPQYQVQNDKTGTISHHHGISFRKLGR